MIRPAFYTVGALLATGAAPAALRGQESPAERVDRAVSDAMAARRIPGLALAVMRGGQVVLARGYGVANLEHRVPVRPETVFQSGSVGKQFTATLVMMLVGEGKIALDAPVSRYLPDAPASWRDITVERLLTHTSGLGDYPEGFDFRRDYTEDDLRKVVYASPLEFPPGSRWRYSNLGYVTLGILVHQVTGRFYGDLLRERIFEPLGMTTARVISESDIVPNRAAGYVLRDDGIRNQEWVAPSLNTTADGALYFSVLDLARWDAGLGAGRVLGPAALERMWTPVTLTDGTTRPYGYGWAVATRDGRRLVEHGGSWQGFRAFIVRYLDDGLSIALLANLGSGQTRLDEIAAQVAALYLPGAPGPAH